MPGNVGGAGKRFLEECKSQGRLSSDEWERAADIFGSRLILEKNPVLLEYLKESLRKNRQISAGIGSASAGEAGAPEKEKTADALHSLRRRGIAEAADWHNEMNRSGQVSRIGGCGGKHKEKDA